MTKEKIKNGDKVYTIKEDLTIETKIINEISDALKFDKDKQKQVSIKKYKLDAYCGCGVTRDKFFTKRSLAELEIKKFISKLKFPIGAVVILKEYNNYTVGRITKYVKSDRPYQCVYLSEYNSNINNYSEKELVMVKDSYIEEFEDAQEVISELAIIKKEYEAKYSYLQRIYDKFAKDLKTDCKKYNSMWTSKKRKLKFKDIFVKNDEEYDED